MQDCNIFEIWEDYKSALYLFVFKKVRNKDLSKDILQDVLLKSYQFCSKGKTVSYLKAWLYKIAINTIVDNLRKAGRHEELNDEWVAVESSVSLVGEASLYIKSLLHLLPAEYTRPLVMYDLEGISQKEIAEQLHLSLTNTKSRIQRARIKLKELFLECCVVSFNEHGEMTSFAIKPNCRGVKGWEN